MEGYHHELVGIRCSSSTTNSSLSNDTTTVTTENKSNLQQQQPSPSPNEQSNMESCKYNTTTSKWSVAWRQLEEIWADSTGVKDISALKLRVDQASETVDHQTRLVQELRLQVQRDTSLAEQLTARHKQVLYLHKENTRGGIMTEEDIRSFAQLTADESRARAKATQSLQELANAELKLDQAQVVYLNALRQRYHEEQVWQDKWRVLGTYWTWLLIALNSAVFAVSQVLHWRREEHRLTHMETILLREFPETILPQLTQHLLLQQHHHQQQHDEAQSTSATVSTSQQPPPQEEEEEEGRSTTAQHSDDSTTDVPVLADTTETTTTKSSSPPVLLGDDDDDSGSGSVKPDAEPAAGHKWLLLQRWNRSWSYFLLGRRNQPTSVEQVGVSSNDEELHDEELRNDDKTDNNDDDVDSRPIPMALNKNNNNNNNSSNANFLHPPPFPIIIMEWIQQLHAPSVAVGAITTLIVSSLLSSFRRSNR